jgi:hypothetical protein
MIRNFFLVLITMILTSVSGMSQAFIKTPDLFKAPEDDAGAGSLNIIQDPAIDSLISRYILGNDKLAKINRHYGMPGFRIQIYNSSNRNAREEANKAMADFIVKFPDIKSYLLYAEPGWWKTRVGDFRTRTEATRLYLLISKEFRNSYIVPDFIEFPDQNTK